MISAYADVEKNCAVSALLNEHARCIYQSSSNRSETTVLKLELNIKIEFLVTL